MSQKQARLLAQAAGELLVALKVVRNVPLTGPELLMHLEVLTEDAKTGRVALIPTDHVAEL